MAFYIESRFVDIRMLVDFSEFDESNFHPAPVLNTTPANTLIETASLPIQSPETLDNSQALTQITNIIIENESQTATLNSLPKNDITLPVSADKSLLTINQINETITPADNINQSDLPALTVEVVDKTSLFTKYINQKYEQETAAELIRILLNPFIVILAYRYEFLDSADGNSFAFNLRQLKNLVDKNIPELGEDSEILDDLRFQADLLEYNRKKELDRKMQRR